MKTLKEEIDATRMVCNARVLKYCVIAITEDKFDLIGFGTFANCAKRCIRLNNARTSMFENVSFSVFPANYILDAIEEGIDKYALDFGVEVKDIDAKYTRIKRMMRIRRLRESILEHEFLAREAREELNKMLSR